MNIKKICDKNGFAYIPVTKTQSEARLLDGGKILFVVKIQLFSVATSVIKEADRAIQSGDEKVAASVVALTKDILSEYSAILDEELHGMTLKKSTEKYVSLCRPVPVTIRSSDESLILSAEGDAEGYTFTVRKDHFLEDIKATAASFDENTWFARQITNGGTNDYMSVAKKASSISRWFDDLILTVSANIRKETVKKNVAEISGKAVQKAEDTGTNFCRVISNDKELEETLNRIISQIIKDK